MIDFYFIRHAESEMNCTPHIIGGRSNSTPLSEKGLKQCCYLARSLERYAGKFDEVYSSTALRAIQTCKETLKFKEVLFDGEIILTDEILELDQGDWEGELRSEIYTPEVLMQIDSDPLNFKAPNGESKKDVEDRMTKWLLNTFSHREGENIKVAVFTHGFSIKCLLRGLLNFNPCLIYNLTTNNASITRIRYIDDSFNLYSYNESQHLLDNYIL